VYESLNCNKHIYVDYEKISDDSQTFTDISGLLRKHPTSQETLTLSIDDNVDDFIAPTRKYVTHLDVICFPRYRSDHLDIGYIYIEIHTTNTHDLIRLLQLLQKPSVKYENNAKIECTRLL